MSPDPKVYAPVIVGALLILIAAIVVTYNIRRRKRDAREEEEKRAAAATARRLSRTNLGENSSGSHTLLTEGQKLVEEQAQKRQSKVEAEPKDHPVDIV